MLGLRLARIIGSQRFEIRMTRLIDLLTPWRELFLTNMPRFAGDGLAFAAIDSEQLRSKYLTSLAEARQFSTGLLPCRRMIFANIRPRFERWSEPAQQPHHLHMTMCLVRYCTAGTQLVQVSIDVELQQLTRLIGRPTCFLGSGILKPQSLQMQAIDIDIHDTNGVRIVTVVIDHFGEKPDLIAVKPSDIAPRTSPKTGCVFAR
jgi:hypothetical protein